MQMKALLKSLAFTSSDQIDKQRSRISRGEFVVYVPHVVVANRIFIISVVSIRFFLSFQLFQKCVFFPYKIPAVAWGGAPDAHPPFSKRKKAYWTLTAITKSSAFVSVIIKEPSQASDLTQASVFLNVRGSHGPFNKNTL